VHRGKEEQKSRRAEYKKGVKPSTSALLSFFSSALLNFSISSL
jgi:hypothetical protein